MPTFRLTQDTMTRLRMKFAEFQHNRNVLGDVIDDYIADYRQTSGSMLSRQEVLKEKYLKRTPNFTHLIWSDDEDNNQIWWTAADIAIVLGREKSSVTRTLASMERSEGWCSKLLALRRTDKAANGLTIFSYRREIFDLIIDRYEEEYLMRFSNPRHGNNIKEEDFSEIKRFWNYMKLSYAAETEQRIVNDENEYELPDIPIMNWKDIFSLIWRKLFTVRTGTLFSVIFAMSFELSRRFEIAKTFFMTGAAISLSACVILIRIRKWRIDVLADLGAGSLLFLLLWCAGISSGGMYAVSVHAPTQRDLLMNTQEAWVEAYRINDEIFVTIHPVLYSDLADDVEALEYGINSEPDTMIRKEDFRDNYEKILSTRENTREFVTSRLLFRDKTTSEIRRDKL